MLPPPQASLINTNPNFANLYKHLTTNVLAPDGSTLANVPEQNSVSTRLNEARASAIQDDLLQCALEELATIDPTNTGPENREDHAKSRLPPRSEDAPTLNSATSGIRSVKATSAQQSSLPAELRELIFNTTAYLSASVNIDSIHPLPNDVEELIAEDLTAFQSHLPQITRLLSSHLVDTERALSSLTAPFVPQPTTTSTSIPVARSRIRPQYQQPIPSLSSSISALKSSSQQAQSQHLSSTLTSTSTSLDALQTSHSASLKARIRTLELETHGSRSRYAMARSAYLSTVARGIELKTRILALEKEKAIYGDDELLERMVDEVEGLEGEERRLEGRERELMGLLEEYEDAGRQAGLGVGSGTGRKGGDVDDRGEEVFRILGARYKEVESEIEEVRKDVERLETRVWRGR